nr:hypothetical protein [Tanacetum cinerariifolium]
MIHANVSRFQITPLKEYNQGPKYDGGGRKYSNRGTSGDGNLNKVQGKANSSQTYLKVAKGMVSADSKEVEVPTLVLNDDCLHSKDLSKCLLGRVKEFASLAKLKMTLSNEGFSEVKVRYMGEKWVLLEFDNTKSMSLFEANVSMGSCFSQINQASSDFVTDGRIALVEVEGVPFKTWSANTFKRIAERWGTLLDIDDQEEMCYHSKRLCIQTKSHRRISEDFKCMYRGNIYWIQAAETPGWVPDFLDEDDEEVLSEMDSKDGKPLDQDLGSCDVSVGEAVPDTVFEEEGMIKDELGEDDGVKNTSEGSIGESINKDSGTGDNGKDGNDKGEQSGMKSKNDSNESVCSGHFKKSEKPRTGGSILNVLDDVVKVGQVMGYKMDGCIANMAEIIESQGEADESVGNSGGILCVWDPNVFCKYSATVSDYFILIRGRWRHTGEVVVMGDFNEVRVMTDRFGSVFNVKGAHAFNTLISLAGLVEVPLGGCTFTWCHKLAKKMSKLDRFLVSINLFNTFPNISAITLERYLSDHRPILPREQHFDYGPIPFKFYHYWMELEGIRNVVEVAWKDSPCDDSNAISCFMDKYLADLEEVEGIIDSGGGDDEIAMKRAMIVQELQDIDKRSSLELAQKAKVKWAIEGDVNTSFLHGMLNKKRNSLSIRGIMVEGIELESMVSNEEIKRAVWDCGLDKAPGPDGFTFGFYRQFWYLIEEDVYKAVKYFFVHGVIPKGCNASFVALIPKIQDANLIKDFRPISLIGEVVVMGDFNEVRVRTDRFGSVFNVKGAHAFNTFISLAGLVEVPLGGSITLERYLSHHRPILLREQHFDYCPIPFKFYHYWMELEGFRNVVEVAWKDSPCDDSNAISCFMGKLKFLKNKIREWNKQYMASRKHVKDKYLADLEEVEGIIDSGGGNDEIAMKRAMIVQELQDIDKRSSLELAQKAKVKWVIEGDENTSFFHGMLNKKRNSLSIRGIMVEGVWIDEPKLVKNEFLTHFRRSFLQPDLRRAIVHMNFPNTLSLEQQIELESMVSNEEIKRAVWDCGLDKAPGPDGFTFEFYRQFWYLIEEDVYKAVKYFFCLWGYS